MQYMQHFYNDEQFARYLALDATYGARHMDWKLMQSADLELFLVFNIGLGYI